MNEPSEETFAELREIATEMHTSSLMVSIDWLDLVDREGEAKAFEIVGKLKDLLG